ncbi:MAG TPA: S9 family peptidase [Candidatus Limnocylindrales bacterium]
MNEPLTLDRFYSAPRLSGLRLSPDGRRLVVAVTRRGPEPNEMRTALWQVDPAGTAAPRRLTRSSAGESAACFASDGALLFTSARPDPDAKADPDRKIAALWMLPADGGEARLLLAPDGGIEGVAAARNAGAIAFGSLLHPSATSLEDDAARAKARTEAGVGAMLLEDYPIRFWDHWLAPRRQRFFAAALPADPEAGLDPTDVTGDVGPAFLESDFDISHDGRTIVTGWADWSNLPATPVDLVAIDVETRTRRTLGHGDSSIGDLWFGQPRVSPDGRFVACTRATSGTPDEAAVRTIWLFDLSTGEGRDLTPTLDLWPEAPVWAPDSSAVFFVADRLGWVAAFRVDVADGKTTCLVSEGAVTDLCPSPDGQTIYALGAMMTAPPRIVRFSASGESQTPVELPRSIDDGGVAGRGRVERLTAQAADGTAIGSWLVLPPEASAESPAPLVVFAHGGPIGSWTGWHWRWNPQLLAERGYAVLMPDPAISIGYGQHMVERGWGRWGEAPYTDIVAALDSALARPDLDASRTALAGGSFGGYMANWVAGHTNRFRAIVTHASLWDLRPFHGTTDTGAEWEHEMGDPYRRPELYEGQSPAAHIGSIKTPMLVIHGERDFRVPIGEALGLWTDLRRHGVPARFLYFPDENHWILKPNNARLWYETVLAFLDEHVLGKEWVRPALL